MARKKFYSIRGKYKPGNPRVGSYTLTDGRTGFQINSDDAAKQYNGVWVHPKFWRPRHPHDFWPSIPDELGLGESGNALGSVPLSDSILQCVNRDAKGNVIGVYESTNQFTCELASTTQVDSYQPNIADQEFSVAEADVVDTYLVGTVVATDPNSSALTYFITGGNGDPGSELFRIDSTNGKLYIVLGSRITTDDTPYEIEVTVTNQGSDSNTSQSADMTINIREFAVLNLALWVDSSDVSSLTMAANRVEQWDDLSGEDRHFAQSTAGSRPLYLGAGAGIEFSTDSANTGYHLINDAAAAVYAFMNGTADGTIVMACKAYEYTNTGGTVTRRPLATTLSGAGFNMGITYTNAGARTQTVVSKNNSTTISSVIGEDMSLTMDTKIVWAVLYDHDDTPKLQTQVDTDAVVDGTDSTTSSGSSPSATMYLGTDPTNTTANNGNFRGVIYEILVYDRKLTTTELTAARTYLNTKWGI